VTIQREDIDLEIEYKKFVIERKSREYTSFKSRNEVKGIRKRASN